MPAIMKAEAMNEGELIVWTRSVSPRTGRGTARRVVRKEDIVGDGGGVFGCLGRPMRIRLAGL